MARHWYLTALLSSVLSACALSIDPSLEGKRCDDEGACVPGYVCSPVGLCVRAGSASATASIAQDAAIADAHTASNAPDTAIADAHVAPNAADAAMTDAQVASSPSSTSATDPTSTVPGRVANTPDSSVADAGPSDAAAVHDAADSQASSQQPTAATDAGTVVPPPPTTVNPPTMMMPNIRPAKGGGAPGPGTTPPPMMGEHPGTMMDCPVEFTKCENACVDLQTDSDHCGECDHDCGKQEWCKAGSCKKAGP